MNNRCVGGPYDGICEESASMRDFAFVSTVEDLVLAYHSTGTVADSAIYNRTRNGPERDSRGLIWKSSNSPEDRSGQMGTNG